LYTVGEKEKALPLFKKLGEQVRDTKADAWPYHYLVESEYHLGLKDLAFEHCARILERVKSVGSPSGLLGEVFPERGVEAEWWWHYCGQKFAGEGPAATMKRVRAVMEGGVSGKELAAVAREAEQAARQRKPQEREQALHALADTCRAAGQRGLAQRCLEEAAAATAS